MGFFFSLGGFWENVRAFTLRLRFLSFFSFFFFFLVDISSRALIPLFMPESVHSGSASWDDRSQMFPDTLCVSSFPDRFPYYAWTAAYLAHSDFAGSEMYAYLGVTRHLHSRHNDRGLLRAIAVTRGWNGHRIRVSTQSWLWRRKFSRRSCRDSNSQPFDHESGALTNKLSRLPGKKLMLARCHTAVWRMAQIRQLMQHFHDTHCKESLYFI